MSLASPQYLEAEGRLPKELKPIMRQLTQEYEYFTTVHYGRGYVAYPVLADLVLSGWRPTEEPKNPKKKDCPVRC